MNMYRYAVLVLIFFLSACSASGGDPTLEIPPVEPTAPGPEQPPLEPTPGGPPITPTPDTAIEDPSGLPADAIFISQPGPQSEVVSPVIVSGEADATFEQNLLIQVVDENGEVLTLQPASIQADIGQRGPFEAEVSFSVASDQPGRISVFDMDVRDGSLVHLSSVDVTLLASGEARIEAPPSAAEVIALTSPEFQADVSGGTLVVEGFSEYFFEANLGVVICGGGAESDVSHALCGTANNVFLESFATIDAADIGQPGPFRGEISFSVEGPTSARVIVYATSPRDGGLLHASSTLVTLLP